MGMHGFGWMMGLGAALFSLLLLAGLALLVVLLVRMIAGGVRDDRRAPRPDTGGTDNAKQILAERFARGEIDSDEYQDRLSHLQGS